MASLMITGGRLADLFGRKKVFIIGASMFGSGALISALAPKLWVLLLGWSIIEGIGSALMLPVTLSLILENYRDKDRMLAFGIWGGIGAAGTALGPLYGGFMTSNFSWRWAFGGEAIIIALILIFAWLITSQYKPNNDEKSIDVTGAALSALGLGSLIYGLIQASTYGWWHAKAVYQVGTWQFKLWDMSITPFFLLAGSLILVLFYFWERKVGKRGHNPIVNFDVFKNANFTSGIITLAMLSAMLAGIVLVIPIFLQIILGLDAFHTGLTLLSMSLTVFALSIGGVKLGQVLSPRLIVQSGIALVLISVVALSSAIKATSAASDLTWGLILLGIGQGAILSQISGITLSSLSKDQFGEASGLTSAVRMFSGALGTAIIGTIFLSSLTANMIDLTKDSSVIPNVAKPALVRGIESAQTSSDNKTAAQTKALPPTIAAELSRIKNAAGVKAAKDSLYYSLAIFIGAATLASFWLPKKVEQLDIKDIE